MKTEFLCVACLGLGLLAGSGAISFVGNDLTTAANWRTSGVVKANDIDGDNVYGTGGYYLPAGRRSGYEPVWLSDAVLTGASNDDDLNTLPPYLTSFEFTEPQERGRSWGGAGGNFGVLDSVGDGHTGLTGAPILRNDATAAPLSLTLKRNNAPDLRLTLIFGSANEGGFNDPAGLNVTLREGEFSVTENAPVPGFSAATTYQSWDISAGSSDIVIEIEGLPVGVGIARLAGLAVDVPAVIPTTLNRPPQGGVWLIGSPFAFSVDAAGTGPLSYQWYKDGVAMDGRNDATLALSALTTADAGAYRVVVGNSLNSVTSAPAVLTVATTLPAKSLAFQQALLATGSVISEYGFNTADSSDLKGLYHGTLSGLVDFKDGPAAGADKALALRGGGHVQLGPNTDFEFGGGAGTVELWVQADWSPANPPPYNPCLLANRNGGPTRWSLHMMQAKTQLALWNGNRVGTLSIPDAGPGWHHLVSVFDADLWRVYWDGVLVGETSLALGGQSGLPTQIGSSSDASTTEGWVGALDEVTFHATALTAEQVAAHYNAFVVGDPPLVVVQPQSALLFTSTPAVLSAAISGAQVSLQWFKNDTLLTGATGPRLEFTPAQESDAGRYYLVGRNPTGVVTSQVAVVVVANPSFPQYRANVLNEPGLLSLYHFDTGDVTDLVGTHHGFAVDQLTFAAGLGGGDNLAVFPGTTGHVALDPVPDFEFTSGVGTVEAWIQADWSESALPPYNPCIAANRDGGSTRWSLHLMQAKNQVAFWNGSRVGLISVPHAGTGWHHLVSVFNQGIWQVYWDGNLAGEMPIPFGERSGLPTQLGSSSPTSTIEGWVGGIDEVGFYAGALSDVTVRQHYLTLVGPRLNLAKDGANWMLSWPVGASSMVLESTSSLGSIPWTPVPGVVGTSYTFAPGAPSRLFRLRAP